MRPPLASTSRTASSRASRAGGDQIFQCRRPVVGPVSSQLTQMQLAQVDPVGAELAQRGPAGLVEVAGTGASAGYLAWGVVSPG